MNDYGHDLLFGVFITPVAQPAQQAVELAVAAEQAGLDLATFQDHPYQPRFHDTWTLLSYIAARTQRIRISANVHNLPLRQPAVLARSAASLDLLSGGRFEMALGAGGFWDAIAAMGGRRLSPGESIEALGEAIQIMRMLWDTEERSGARLNGTFYQVNGAKRGPAPAHKIEIWVGAYKPRILALTGRLADGWVPSLAYLERGLPSLGRMNQHIDEAAEVAGRPAASVRRMLNIGGQFSPNENGLLNGPPAMWAEQLAEMTFQYGTSAFILAVDDAAVIERFAKEVAPATRELVAAERNRK
ncbi:MAG: LLM class flavin-dependent oxidoreductase [Anaerolineales bacterium]|nr:MAG: LLM class flavin-dependent oxidoreductase [Anaerolineales bacterium]